LQFSYHMSYNVHLFLSDLLVGQLFV